MSKKEELLTTLSLEILRLHELADFAREAGAEPQIITRIQNAKSSINAAYSEVHKKESDGEL